MGSAQHFASLVRSAGEWIHHTTREMRVEDYAFSTDNNNKRFDRFDNSGF